MDYFLSPALAQLRAEINALWPHRDKTSDGWIGDTSHAARPSDHNPDWSADGIVRALDIDEDLTLGLAAVGAAMPLVNAILRDPRTRYVIYEGRIWNVDTQRWSTYTGPNAHRHHVHVSVRKVGNYDRDASPWSLAARIGNDLGSIPTVTVPNIPGAPAPITPEDDMSAEAERKIDAIYDALFNGGTAMPGGLPMKDRIEARFNQVDKSLASISKTSAQARDAAAKAVEQTGPINRTGGPVSLRQEIADTKTAVLALKPGNPAEVDVQELADALKTTLGAAVADELATRLKG